MSYISSVAGHLGLTYVQIRSSVRSEIDRKRGTDRNEQTEMFSPSLGARLASQLTIYEKTLNASTVTKRAISLRTAGEDMDVGAELEEVQVSVTVGIHMTDMIMAREMINRTHVRNVFKMISPLLNS